MTLKELSRHTGISSSWLYQNYKKEIPHFYKKGEGKKKGRPYFKRSEIDRWLEQFRKEPEKDITGYNTIPGVILDIEHLKPEPIEDEATPLKVRPFRRQKAGKTTSL